MDFDLNVRLRHRSRSSGARSARKPGTTTLFVTTALVMVLAFAYFVLGIPPDALIDGVR